MSGWKFPRFFASPPFCLPSGVRAAGLPPDRPCAATPLICLFLTFLLSTGARLLELPFWDNSAFRMGDEYLLATHDAYHWIAGAEGFEFGVGHPMSEFARFLATAANMSPAQVGFWLPPFMGGVLAVGIFLWGWGLGHPFAGLCAGVISSLAPAFCARTLLGFYDTDLVILLFSLLLGLVPALWLNPWLISPLKALRRLAVVLTARLSRLQTNAAQETPGNGSRFSSRDDDGTGAPPLSSPEKHEAMFAWPWMLLLMLSGTFGHWIEDWHSLFPYLTRFAALITPALVLVLGPSGARAPLLRAALCYALPVLCGIKGAVAALLYCTLLRRLRRINDKEEDASAGVGWPRLRRLTQRALHSGAFLIAAWIGIAWLACDAAVYELMMQSFAAYSNRSGDIAAASPAAPDPLIFPSVAQSIIEVQTIALQELCVYIYPIEIITVIAFALFLYRLMLTPVMIWFVPLLALALLSLKMGARMIMFAPPALMLSLCMEGGALLEYAFFRLIMPFATRARRQESNAQPVPAASPAARSPLWKEMSRLTACLFCTACLSWPLITLLPEYTQGPIISREQADALIFINKNTREDSFVWNWWDWGYATHHFARRHTIADGARHGGPSLFLPAAVYTTADPRFARQIIKYAASRDNVPGTVFADLSAPQAQQLMRDLGDPDNPLIAAPGRQYVVVSLELLRLGLWVTRYGSWNFETRQSSGSLMNNLSQAIEFNVDTGVIQPERSQPVYADSIDIFGSAGLERRSYNRYGAYHFIFNTQTATSRQEDRVSGPLALFWKMQRGDFPFTASISDKMVVDEVFYNTMMVQLLLCPKDDPGISPFFRLVFDNVYTRVYEVL
jgi:dolichyl-diphosphooligosaccharide--protein glycosyltransferase